MGKQTICICENKDADQLRGNREADQRLCFRHTDNMIPLLLNTKFQASSLLLLGTVRFVSDLVGNPNCWFCHAQAHLLRLCFRQTAGFNNSNMDGHIPTGCLHSTSSHEMPD